MTSCNPSPDCLSTAGEVHYDQAHRAFTTLTPTTDDAVTEPEEPLTPNPPTSSLTTARTRSWRPPGENFGVVTERRI